LLAKSNVTKKPDTLPEITKDEGAKTLALQSHGGDRRSEDVQPCANTSLKYGTAEHWQARLARDDLDMAARVRRGELSADAAAKQKGWRKPRPKHTKFEQIVKWLSALTPEERHQLNELLR
jgi:hypothetical protein